MKTEESGNKDTNIINFTEVAKKFEPKKKRIFVLPKENILKLMQFLYSAEDDLKYRPEILPEGDADLMEDFSRDLGNSLIFGDGELNLSRVDIDKLGVWFEIFKPTLRGGQRKVSSLIMDLDKRFVAAGGLENQEFMKEVG